MGTPRRNSACIFLDLPQDGSARSAESIAPVGRHLKGTNKGPRWPPLEGPAGTCLLVDNEILFEVAVPPSEKMNLIEISLLFTAEGTAVKWAAKRMDSRPGTFLDDQKST